MNLNNLAEIDAQIERIWGKMEQVSKKTFKITCGQWPPQWKPPLPEEAVCRFEQEKGIQLPPDYRRFITTKASAGTQPFYGLETILQQPNKGGGAFFPEKPFPCTPEKPLVLAELTDEEAEAFFESDVIPETQGWIPLCTEGCGMDSILIVNTEDPQTYGTVWYFDLANDCGVVVQRDPKEHQPIHFLDWLEYWVDTMLTLKPEEYMTFAQLIWQLDF